MTPGLERIRAVLRALDNPERRFPSVLITGTNGKGSVAAMLAAVLGAAGHRAGLYTSPHLIDPRERIALVRRGRTRAESVSSSVFENALAAVRRAAEKESVSVSFFEALTAAAFFCFARARADIAVVEVGMGGTWDATNVLHPLVSVVTNVDLDHTERLGRTRPAIARDKAGIARRGRPLVAGNMHPAAFAALMDTARKTGARVVPVARKYLFRRGEDDGWTAIVEGRVFRGPHFALEGKHQEENAATALAALHLLQPHFPWDAEALRKGLAAVRHPARLERIAARPATWVDGAHNTAGARALGAWLRERTERPRVLVFAVAQDKDAPAMLRALRSGAETVVISEVGNPRMRPATELARLAQKAGFAPVYVEKNPRRAVAFARKTAGAKGLVCICGSLYLAGEILRMRR